MVLKQFYDSSGVETDIQITEVIMHRCHDFFMSWKSFTAKELMQIGKEMKIKCLWVWGVSGMYKNVPAKVLEKKLNQFDGMQSRIIAHE